MPLISSSSIIRALALFHLTIAYFLLTDPAKLINQNLVFILGQSMRLDDPHSFDRPTPATAFAAIIFALLALSDLNAVSMAEEHAINYWSAQAPMRVAFLIVVTAYPYLFKEDGFFGSKATARGVGGNLQNSLVFAFGFLELSAWFWAWLNIREERRQAAVKRMEQRKGKPLAG